MTTNFGLSYSRALIGIKALEVQIEAHIQPGLPKFSIVGLPETAVKEASHRVKGAIINSGFDFPNRTIVVSLAPANFPKAGSCFDLAIAVSILIASRQIPAEAVQHWELLGELSLSGQLRPIPGILAMAFATKKANKQLIIPTQNIDEALLVDDIKVIGFDHLTDVTHYFNKLVERSFAMGTTKPHRSKQNKLDQVFGQNIAKRALIIAAAGGHNLLMSGPPGCGKSMLASCLPDLLPPLSNEEAMEVAMIYSISQQGFDPNTWGQRPFRSPHHSASMPALVGGGNPPKPGEISLAHCGVLFLDELPEYPRSVLEALREPLESGEVLISRAHWQCPFPAKTQLIAAMNPCPCGFDGLDDGRCRCTIDQIHKYQSKISGPLLDRIDLHMSVLPVDSATLLLNKHQQQTNQSKDIIPCWQKQLTRQQCRNADLSASQLQQFCQLNEDDRIWLADALKKLQLSARSIHRILKVARTITDLNELKNNDKPSCFIEKTALMEALSYARRFHSKRD